MANLKASIVTYRKMDGVWKYRPPTYGKNNKIIPEKVAYYVRWRDGRRLRYQRCSSAADAENACKRQEAYLNAAAHGLTLAQQETKARPALMSEVLDGWLEEYRLSHGKESYALMNHTIREFYAWSGANLITKWTRVSLLRYRAYCIDNRKNSARTAANKMMRVAQFHRSVMGIDPGKGLVTVKDAKFTELEPTVYNDDELAAFFKQCDSWRVAIFKCYLMAGLRKAELESLEWTDVDFKAGTVTVSPKPDFTPKDHEQRTIEIPDELLTILKELPHRGKTVFANSSGNKYTHSWDDCKAIGKKANIVDCHPHKFRATFATRNLQEGMDLKTVQKLLGHKDIESTMRYLSRAESKKTRAKVNAVWA